MEDSKCSLKLFKVRVSFLYDDSHCVDSYESIALSPRDILTISFALQLGHKVIIENV